MVPTNYYLILSAMIFAIGAVGVLSRRNALIIFMCVEMMLNSVNLTLIAMSRQWNNLNGQIFVFIIMAVAVSISAGALASWQRKLDCDVLVSGHTHQRSDAVVENRLFLNPGSATGAFSGVGEPHLPSFMLLEANPARLT